jgi:hypothetical protein
MNPAIGYFALSAVCVSTAILMALTGAFRATPRSKFEISFWLLKAQGSSFGLGSSAMFLAAALAFARLAFGR